MLECSSLSERYSSKCFVAKGAIDFDILYLYHSSLDTNLNILIAGPLSDKSLSDVVLVAYEEEQEYLLFLFLFLLFLECFLFLIREELSLVGLGLLPLHPPLLFLEELPSGGLDSFQFSHHLCHYGLEMCGVLLLEPLERHLPVTFAYTRSSMIKIFQDL